MGIIARFNLFIERLMRRIHGLFYLFKDMLKKPRILTPERAWGKLVFVFVLSIVYSLWSMAPVAEATIPKYINFQGKLTDSEGTPVDDGTYSIIFRLYSAETGGTALWTETQSVTLTNGVFNVALGTETALNLSFNTQYWLSVQVGSDSEMTPRQRLTASGYALNADNLDTYTSGQFLRSDDNDSASGQLTLTYPGLALVVQPSSAPSADTKLVNLKDTDGTSQFSVDYEGDMSVSGTAIITSDLTSSATVTATSFIGDGSTLTGLVAGEWTDEGTVVHPNEPTIDNVAIGGSDASAPIYLAASGEATFTSDLTVSSTVTATSFFGDGSTLTGLVAGQWTDAGDYLYPADGDEYVATSSAGAREYADSDGDLYIAGDLEIDGTAYIAAANISSDITLSGTNMLYLADGSASAPSLTFEDDTDTGLYRAADDTLGITAAGAERMKVSDSEITVGEDDTGYDVKFYGATSGAYMYWDESEDQLKVVSGTNKISTSDSSDLTLEPGGDDVLVDGGLTVGSSTQAGDNNLRVEGTSTVVGNADFQGDVANSSGSLSLADDVTISSDLTLSGTDANLYLGSSGSVDHASASPDAYIQGNLEVDGNCYLGDASVDTITIAGSMTLDQELTFSGTNMVYLADGTQTAPSLTFEQDTNTGFYRAADDTLGVTTGGAERMRVSDSEITVGEDDTGYDVKFYGATSGAYLLWDEDEDRLQLVDTDAGTISTTSGDITLDPSGNNVLPGGASQDYLGAAGTEWLGLYSDDVTTGTLTASGDADFQGDVADSSGSLSLADEVTISSDLTLTGTDANLYVGSSGSFDHDDVTTADAYIQGNLEVDGNCYLGDATVDTITIAGSMTLDQELTFSGTNMLYLADGSATAPSLTFEEDMDTGLYRPADDTLGITTGGTDTIRLSHDGTNSTITATSGNINVGSGGSDLTLSSGVDIVVEGDMALKGDDSAARTITVGQTGSYNDVVAIDASNWTVGTAGNADFSSDVTISGTTADLYVDSGGTFNNNSTLPDAYIQGNLEVDGNCYLGDASTDTLTVQGSFSIDQDMTMSGTNMLYLADGSATAPSLTFEDDTDTGLFSPENGEVAITTDGSEALRVDSSGNVGIGTTSPEYKLQVEGDIFLNTLDKDIYMRVDNSRNSSLIWWCGSSVISAAITSFGPTSYGRKGLAFYTKDSLNWNDAVETMRIDTDGDVGIGDTTPDAHLEVSANGGSGGNIFLLSSDDGNDGDLLTVAESGNVGIGLTSPDRKLEVDGTAGFTGDLTVGSTTATFDNASGSADLYVEGNLEVDGNCYLGDATVDTITIAGSMTLNQELTFSGTNMVYLADGTQTAPSLTFEQDMDTGLYRPDDDTLGITTGGTDTIRISHDGTNSEITATSGSIELGSGGGNLVLDTGVGLSASNWSVGTAGNADFSSDVTISGTTADLYVDSGGTFDNNSSLPDAYIQGNLEVDGNCYLGDASTDTLTVQGSFSIDQDMTMSGTNMLYLADGTATAPSLAFEDDTDTGLYSPSDGQVAITTDGSEALRVDSSGNVGIGYTSPTHKLDVDGDINIPANAVYRLNSSPVIQYAYGGGEHHVYFMAGDDYIDITSADDEIAFYTNDGSRMTIDSSGNVGIGLTSPDRKLEVDGTAGFTGDLTVGSTTATFDNASGSPDLYVEGNLEVDGSCYLGDASVDTITIAGSMTLSQELTFSGTNMVYLADGTATAPSLTFEQDMDTGLYRPADDTLGITTGGTEALRVARDGSDATVVNTGGDIKIGSAGGDLTLASGVNIVSGGSDNSATFSSDLTLSGSTASLYVSGANANNQISGISNFDSGTLYVDPTNDRVGIGTTSPESELHVSSSDGATLYVKSASGNAAGFAVERPDGTWARLHAGLVGASFYFENGKDFRINEADSGDTPTKETGWGGDTYLIADSSEDNIRIYKETIIDGDLGIGTTSPGAKLDVVGDARISDSLTLSGTSRTASQGILFAGDTNLYSSAADTLKTDDNFVVGGTVSFSDDLTMSGTNMLYLADGTVTAPSLTFEDDTDTGLFSPANGEVAITTDGSQRMVVDSSGRVGIGTTSPEFGLEVTGTIASVYGSPLAVGTLRLGNGTAPHPTQYSDISFSSSGNTLILTTYYNDNNAAIIFKPKNSEAMRIKGSGNVGIGDTSPDAHLEVSANGGSGGNIFLLSSDDDNDGDLVAVLESGNVGIGLTSPDRKLEVDGTAGFTGDLTIGSTTATFDNASGSPDLYVEGNLEVDGNCYLGDATVDTITIAGSMTLSQELTFSGTNMLYLADGSATAPSLTFEQDMDTGLYRPADDVLGIAAGGTDALRISHDGSNGTITNASGDVYIGTGGGDLTLDSGVDIIVEGDMALKGDDSAARTITIGQTGTYNDVVAIDASNWSVGTAGNADFSSDVTISGTTADLYVDSGGTFNNNSTLPDAYIQGNLEVDGQCVTGDTLLPVIRREVTRGYKRLQKVTRGYIEYLPIVEVKAGDQVLSLNEETGQIEPHRINGLLDMGVKPVFKLTTESGRSIKTTGNHPYLVKLGVRSWEVGANSNSPNSAQWKKVADIKVGEKIAVAGERYFNEILSYDGPGDSQDKATLIQRQEKPTPQLSFPYSITSFVRMDNNAKRSKQEEQTSQNNPQPIGKLSKEITGQADYKYTFSQICQEFSNKFLAKFTQWFHSLNIPSWMDLSSRILQEPAFANAALLAPRITHPVSSGILWERIVSIDYVGREQVYDIEVEGTHNFVAGHWISAPSVQKLGAKSWELGTKYSRLPTPNSQLIFGGIIAHNTYLGDAATDTLTVQGSFSIDQDLTMSGTNMLYLADGTATAPSLTFEDDTNTGLFSPANGEVAITTDGSEALRVDSSGNVGIGTTSPGFGLEVAGTIASAYGVASPYGTLRLGNKVSNQYSTIAFSADSANSLTLTTYFNSDNNAIIFEPKNVEAMRILGSGNVGIGTTSPSTKLEVDGDIKLSGRVRQGCMGDLAEMMPLSSCIFNPANVPLEVPEALARGENEYTPLILRDKEELAGYLRQRPEAADVVIIDEDGGIRRSFTAFATNTAGIISTNPAQILRDGLENSAPVALNGIVPCKVTAENGTIKPGDLLVSSSLPGHAMRAGKDPSTGTVIGKALERLNEEVGVVEVLVMMR